MNKYIVVTTLCKNENIANQIIDTILEKRLASGTQMYKVKSKYWWNNKINSCDEFKIEFRTKEILFEDIQNEIKKIHDYKVAEISSIEIKQGSNDFLNWIEMNTKMNGD